MIPFVFLQFLAENYESYLIYVKYTYAHLPPFGNHKSLLNSNLVSKLISTAAVLIAISFDTPYYTELSPYSPKTKTENWINMCQRRGYSFCIDIFRKVTPKASQNYQIKSWYLKENSKKDPRKHWENHTQFFGSETEIIGHKDIRVSKMASEGWKLRYSNTTAFVLGKDVNFLIVC